MAVTFRGTIWGVQPFWEFICFGEFILFFGIRSLFCRWVFLCSSSLYVGVYGDVGDLMGRSLWETLLVLLLLRGETSSVVVL